MVLEERHKLSKCGRVEKDIRPLVLYRVPALKQLIREKSAKSQGKVLLDK
jgi:hypothetical protein